MSGAAREADLTSATAALSRDLLVSAAARRDPGMAYFCAVQSRYAPCLIVCLGPARQ